MSDIISELSVMLAATRRPKPTALLQLGNVIISQSDGVRVSSVDFHNKALPPSPGESGAAPAGLVCSNVIIRLISVHSAQLPGAPRPAPSLDLNPWTSAGELRGLFSTVAPSHSFLFRKHRSRSSFLGRGRVLHRTRSPTVRRCSVLLQFHY